MSKKENENVNVNTENANTTELVAQTFNGYGVENVKFHNADLILHTEKIIQYREVGKKAELGICYELGQVKNGDLYKKAGFKSIGEYGNVMFDYKASTTGLYAQIGQAFVVMKENVPCVREELPSFTTGQLLELLPLVNADGDVSDIVKLLNDGEIGQFSTTKAIRNAVKAFTAIDTTADEVDEKSEASEASKASEASETDAPKTALDLIDIIQEALDAMLKMNKDGYWSDDETSKLLAITSDLDEIKANHNIVKTENND